MLRGTIREDLYLIGGFAMHVDPQRKEIALCAAHFVTNTLQDFRERWSIGIVLGTGWGDVLAMDHAREMSFAEIPGFERLQRLEGHARRLVAGTIAGRPVLALRGRVHCNETPADPALAAMVRLQTEMLFHLGVRTLIITSAVGSLRGALPVGGVGIVNGFVTLYAPEMPLWAGEFCSPEDAMSEFLQAIALEERGPLEAARVGHVMVRGPFFEGRRYDKGLLAATGAGIVGMSMLPEACIAALYGVDALGLGFVTNDDIATHSHEENLARAKASAEHLGAYLARIIARIP